MTDKHELQRLHALQSSAQRVIDDVRAAAPKADFATIDHFLDYGEPELALSQVSWLIVEERVHVRPAVIQSIRELVRGTSEQSAIPENLDDFAVVE